MRFGTSGARDSVQAMSKLNRLLVNHHSQVRGQPPDLIELAKSSPSYFTMLAIIEVISPCPSPHY